MSANSVSRAMAKRVRDEWGREMAGLPFAAGAGVDGAARRAVDRPLSATTTERMPMTEIAKLAFVVALWAFPLSVLLAVVVFAAKVADIGLMAGASWLWVPAPLLLSPSLFIGKSPPGDWIVDVGQVYDVRFAPGTCHIQRLCDGRNRLYVLRCEHGTSPPASIAVSPNDPECLVGTR